MVKEKVIIHWFRQDLRLADNPALYAAAKEGKVLPIYILDDENSTELKMGAASRVWLHHSLSSLNESLGGNLGLYKGDPEKILPELVKKHDADCVYWNRCYEPWRTTRDKRIKENMEVKSFNGSLLWEPWEVLKKDGTPYRVFTPFYRRGCLEAAPAPREPLPKPEKLDLVKGDVQGLGLLPQIEWNTSIEENWGFGEAGALDRMYDFIDGGLSQYKEGRNFPAQKNVSRLSPSLHFGEISPNQVWYAADSRGDDSNIAHFKSELGWREFSYSLLYNFPNLPKKNLQSKFDNFPWQEDFELLNAWQKGQTGYPIIDAGMRELWQTGFMHNRVRMIVGSFLVKNLLLHWHHGEEWFWDCLVDADLAANSASWQWIAGCGADAAPYFRIFNPITQGHRFDEDGEYTKKYVPELKDMPNKFLYNPWEAPQEVLDKAGVVLGKNYPKPIVDVKKSREKALAAFSSLKALALDNP